MTHVRDEADKSFAALDEEIAIGERARIPVQHSHIKLGTVNVWGKAREFIGVIAAARGRGVDFTADCYPYDAWSSTIKVLVPDKQYENPASVERALADVGGASHVTITEFPPNRSYEMRTLEQLAQAAGASAVEMFIRVIREGDAANNPDTVIDRATFVRPTELPVGIEKVFVNGVLVWSEGKPTGARPVRVLPK